MLRPGEDPAVHKYDLEQVLNNQPNASKNNSDPITNNVCHETLSVLSC